MARRKRTAPVTFAPATEETYHHCLAEDLKSLGLTDRNVVPFAAMERAKVWANGLEITVGFWDALASPRLEEKVREIAPDWCKVANLDFKFVGRDRDAMIRVSFSRDGHWSALGRDSANRFSFPRNSMNLALTELDPDETFRSIVLHEFGHAIGLIHEHQNPGARIPWNEQAVYAFFEQRYGWPRQQTFQNVLKRMEQNSSLFEWTDFDPESIMIYEIPGFLTGGQYELKRQSKLSPNDRRLAAQMYPGRASPEDVGGPTPPQPALDQDEDREGPVELKVGGSPVKARLGYTGDVDAFTFKVVEEGGHLVETLGETNVVMALYGPDNSERWVAEDRDTGRDGNAWLLEYLQPGTYHVRVWHQRDGGSGSYAITVSRWRG
jgi:hypothetical protein